MADSAFFIKDLQYYASTPIEKKVLAIAQEIIETNIVAGYPVITEQNPTPVEGPKGLSNVGVSSIGYTGPTGSRGATGANMFTGTDFNRIPDNYWQRIKSCEHATMFLIEMSNARLPKEKFTSRYLKFLTNNLDKHFQDKTQFYNLLLKAGFEPEVLIPIEYGPPITMCGQTSDVCGLRTQKTGKNLDLYEKLIFYNEDYDTNILMVFDCGDIELLTPDDVKELFKIYNDKYMETDEDKKKFNSLIKETFPIVGQKIKEIILKELTSISPLFEPILAKHGIILNAKDFKVAEKTLHCYLRYIVFNKCRDDDYTIFMDSGYTATEYYELKFLFDTTKLHEILPLQDLLNAGFTLQELYPSLQESLTDDKIRIVSNHLRTYVSSTDPYWHPVRSEQVIGRARRIANWSCRDFVKLGASIEQLIAANFTKDDICAVMDELIIAPQN